MRRFLLHSACMCCLLACSSDSDKDDRRHLPPPATNSPPTAIFTVTPNDLAVTVDARGSTDIDGAIVSYEWSWGDGQSGTGVETSHVYDTAGSYTITLTVTDNEGAVDSNQEVVFLIGVTQRSTAGPDTDRIVVHRALPAVGR